MLFIAFVSRLSKSSSSSTFLPFHHVITNGQICMNDILLMCLCAPASYNLLTHLSKITELNVRHQFWICIHFMFYTHIFSAFVVSLASGLLVSLTNVTKSTANTQSLSLVSIHRNMHIALDTFSPSYFKWTHIIFGNTSKFLCNSLPL